MKKVRYLFLTGLVFAAATMSAQWREPSHELVGRVESVMLEWQEATRAGDAGHIASLYWEDALRIFAFPTGGRHIIEGLDAIAEQQEAEFRRIRREEPELLRRFGLPDPQVLMLPDHLPIMIYGTPEDGVFQIFQFDERRGRVAISRQVEVIREIEPIEAGEAYRWADGNNNGILEPIEQRLLMDQYRTMIAGPHRVRAAIDEWFDWNGDGGIDEMESHRARTILYRDRLRQGFRFFPEFSETFVDFDETGFISIQEADVALDAAFGPGREAPRFIEGPVDERMDLDLDGWIIPHEVESYVFALTRAVVSVPGLPLMGPDTPGEGQWIVWWADADESGFLDEHELMDVGVILLRLLTGTELVTNPIERRYDSNNDFVLSPDERENAANEILAAVDPEEREHLVTAAMDPGRLVGRRPITPVQHEMDNDPENGRLEEHEVFSYLERRFGDIAAPWLADSGAGIQVVEVPADGQFDRPDDELPVTDPDAVDTDTGDGGDDVAPAETRTTTVKTTVTAPTVTTRQVADQVGDELSIAVGLNAVYPVLRKYYDTAPVGTVTLTNTSAADLTNLEVTLSLSKYIDRARAYDSIDSLPAGDSTTVDLTLLFNSDVLDITEGDRLDATVTVAYNGASGAAEETATETMIFYDRNAIRWDDTRRVAAFVTERDEEVRSFARRAIAGTRGDRNEAVDDALQDAMVLFTAMVESDLMYFRDPSSSYSSASSSGTTIDYLQFPRQTLTDFGGDCDDLSVCYNALLESVGRRTAFITVPGHIFPAVALQMSADEARSAFMDPTDLVFDSEGTVWVPVEITALEDSFYEAWQEGAKTYRQYSGSGQAEIIPTSTAWDVYESVESVVDDDVDQPDTDDIKAVFVNDLSEFVNTQIATRELQLQADLVDRPGDRRLLNRLGVLYAQYGLWDKARTQFEAIAESEEYIPALLNLGHIDFLDEDYRSASSYYDRVLRIQSDHPGGLLAAARANHELENYGNVRTYYDQLRGLSPRLAADYAYLDLTSSNDAARAQAASELRGRVLWETETEE